MVVAAIMSRTDQFCKASLLRYDYGHKGRAGVALRWSKPMEHALTADFLIKTLSLVPLAQEGGYFRRTVLAEEAVAAAALPTRYAAERRLYSAIYFLLKTADCSAMHRLDSDEVYHFYAGDPLELLLLHPEGQHELVTIGLDFAAGQQPQVVAPRGTWQGSRPQAGGRHGFSLIGTTMAPAFDWAGFELGDEAQLVADYPEAAALIRARFP